MSVAWVSAGIGAVGLLAGNANSRKAQSAAADANDKALDIADSQASVARDELDWYKKIYNDSAPERAATTERANAVSDAQLAALKKQTAITDDYDAYNKSTFRPLESGIVADANNFDTEAKREELAGVARGDVQQGFDSAEQQQTRQLQRMGVNPSSGRALALSSQLASDKALALASVSNKARTDATTLGYARKMDAASLGRGLSSAQATSAGLALNQGNSAVSNARVAGDVTSQGASLMQAGFSGAQQGLASAGNSYGNIARFNASQDDSGATLGALGSIAGQWAGSTAGSNTISNWIKSDKNAKKNIKRVHGKASLAAFRKIPIARWDYKPGQGDGGHHVGPMAQDVNKVLGEATAPGGTKIDIISMSGHQTNAIKELDAQVTALKKQVLSLANHRR